MNFGFMIFYSHIYLG